MRGKWRILPKQFGKYNGNKTFEIEQKLAPDYFQFLRDIKILIGPNYNVNIYLLLVK